jgi:hypothetical protein
VGLDPHPSQGAGEDRPAYSSTHDHNVSYRGHLIPLHNSHHCVTRSSDSYQDHHAVAGAHAGQTQRRAIYGFDPISQLSF